MKFFAILVYLSLAACATTPVTIHQATVSAELPHTGASVGVSNNEYR